MSLRIAIQSDPLDEMHPEKETTFLLGLEAQQRGHEVWYFTPNDVVLKDGTVYARAWILNHHTGDTVDDNAYSLGEGAFLDLSELDAILIRQAPPVNQRYLINTYILERIADKVFFANDPRSIRKKNGKLFTAEFPEFVVPYVIGNSLEALREFHDEHPDAILKPLNTFGGAGIVRLRPDSHVEDAFNVFRAEHPWPFMAQRFIPEAVEGDKRIILFDGHPEAAILRVPADPDKPANIRSGASVVPAVITERDKAVCDAVGPVLREMGLFFVGLDMLGDWLTEINVISPGTVKPANDVLGTKLEVNFWDRLEARLSGENAGKTAHSG